MTSLDTIVSADYPDVGYDVGRARRAGFDEQVLGRLLNYVAALNLADKVRQAAAVESIAARKLPGAAESYRQHAFARQSYFRLADPTGRAQRYLRIVDVSAINVGPVPGLPPRSVVAFVEIATGLVYKPDGWKRPAKGVRGSLATDEAAAELAGRASQPGHLYAS